MKVRNLISPRSGSSVANQFHIETDKGISFRSYESIIAVYENGVLKFYPDWNYSRTTTKYLNQWLRENGLFADGITHATEMVKQGKVVVL